MGWGDEQRFVVPPTLILPHEGGGGLLPGLKLAPFGADIVRSRQIAQEKMFLIHNTLGEDSKVFEADETPTAARLYSKIMENPETQETLSFLTQMRLKYFELAKKHPRVIDRISLLSSRVKTGKKHHTYNLVVFIRKCLACFFRSIDAGSKPI